MRRRLIGGLLSIAGVLFAGSVAAQDYPTRPVRLIAPFAAGGPVDIIARIFAPAFSAALKPPFIFDNRAGAGGTPGVDAVAKAEPDGYTLVLSGPGALVIVQHMSKLPYDPVNDLAPITVVSRVNGTIVAAANSNYKTLADVVSDAKAHPNKVNFASAGSGTSTHLAGELLNMEAGTKMVHIPHKGAAPAMTDMISGQVQLLLPDLPIALGQVRGGTMRALAVSSPKRSPFLPDVPTTAEAGYPGVLSDGWYGLLAPAKTPPAVLAKIHAAAMEALKSPEVAKQFEAQGGLLDPMTQEQFKAMIVSESAKWKKVVDATGARLE
jgi:tripartite-type tricarboxylate transporter receptor subunit TctC